jgi:hypothetical protein
MRIQQKQTSLYIYLRTNRNEEWKECVDEVIRDAHKKGWIYVTGDYLDCRIEPHDFYDNGQCGAAMVFIRAQEKKGF